MDDICYAVIFACPLKKHQKKSMSIFTSGRKLLHYSVSLFVVIIFFSCKTERIAYFKDLPDNLKSKVITPSPTDAPVIRGDDVLNVTIQTLDPNANSVLNQGNLPVNSGAVTNSITGSNLSQAAIAGYLVDKNGYLHLPYIGDVLVKDLTTTQARKLIVDKISVYFKDPVVNVRFSNFKITVLGEVRNPTTFLLPNENPTVIDALGLAGDITIYGRRDNVMLIRSNEAGQKEIVRLNLDSSKVIASPYFNLHPNDVIYVEPTAERVESASAYRTRDIAIIGSALSLMIIIVARLIR